MDYMKKLKITTRTQIRFKKETKDLDTFDEFHESIQKKFIKLLKSENVKLVELFNIYDNDSSYCKHITWYKYKVTYHTPIIKKIKPKGAYKAYPHNVKAEVSKFGFTHKY